MPQGNAKPTPNLDVDKTDNAVNLTILRRLDPLIEEILITAAPVTLYEFNTGCNQWSRKDIEGPLFVVTRNVQPKLQFIVMNRLNGDNLVENLLGDFEYEVQVPYVLYRNAAQEVNAIWFYNANECEAVANVFVRCVNCPNPVQPSYGLDTLMASQMHFSDGSDCPFNKMQLLSVCGGLSWCKNS